MGKKGKKHEKKVIKLLPLTLWHFPRKNSKDSLHIVDPEFLKS